MATNIEDSGSTDVNIPLDPLSSRVLRQAAQRNAAERISHTEQQRHLESERRATKAHLAREEREVRDHLKRLQEDKRLVSDNPDEEFEYQSVICADDLDDWDLFGATDEVVNPYPIMFPSSARGTPTHRPPTRGDDNAESISRRSHPRFEVADYEMLSSNGRILPSLRTNSKNHLDIGASSTHGSGSNLSRTDSMRSVLSSSPGDKEGMIGIWVGEPEAISSIRRPRKSLARQKLQHQWNRSQSLKERPSSSRSDASRTSVVSRSQSMRDSAKQSLRISPSLSEMGAAGIAHQWSRSNSLKESKASMKNIDTLDEAVGNIDLGSSGRGRRTRSLKARRAQQTQYDTSLERQVSVSSYVGSEGASSMASRRKNLAGQGPAVKPVLSLDKPPPLPPISTRSPQEDSIEQDVEVRVVAEEGTQADEEQLEVTSRDCRRRNSNKAQNSLKRYRKMGKLFGGETGAQNGEEA